MTYAYTNPYIHDSVYVYSCMYFYIDIYIYICMCMYVPPPPQAFDELGGRVASPSNGGCHEEGPQEQEAHDAQIARLGHWASGTNEASVDNCAGSGDRIG